MSGSAGGAAHRLTSATGGGGIASGAAGGVVEQADKINRQGARSNRRSGMANLRDCLGDEPVSGLGLDRVAGLGRPLQVTDALGLLVGQCLQFSPRAGIASAFGPLDAGGVPRGQGQSGQHDGQR